ncbi:MATE family efflux transporter [Tepidibacter hydrothermalis]|uniref:Multidrug export protein MepA n=1 Tax=Tepidibacter hydrothermalis TaxID=3036126 RepID=A0ABY8EFZ4_9FIRM|nr:MATE family efflux transporter [Tepidibacter hydrothermalis]WFD11867.1 MATE family efflux transporter [Tepidibacter hydrothermalis]
MNKDFENINFKNYLKFVLPTIFSMVFISIYTMTDGIFVSRKLGSTALAALNVTLPAFNFIFGSIFMIVIGASAIIGINLGAKEIEKANKNFSNMIYALAFITLFYLVIGLFFSKSIAELLGAKEDLLPYAMDYLFILFIGSVGFVIKIFTEIFLRLEGKFNLSLFATVVGGVTNIILDYLFIYHLNMGIKGAALGTIFGAFINGLFGIVYFAFNHSQIQFTFTQIDFDFLKNSMINGSSEMVSSLSAGITTFLFNTVLLNSVGEIGVSSISIILYVNFLLSSIFIGISMGIQPLLSYNFGANQLDNINKLLKMSCIIISSISILAFTICNIFKFQLISLFNTENVELIEMTAQAFTIFSFTFFISGFNILGSVFFTSLNNGKYSAVISFSRSIVFKSIIILTLPSIIGLSGVWLTIPLSEYLCVIITLYFYTKVKKTKLLDCKITN